MNVSKQHKIIDSLKVKWLKGVSITTLLVVISLFAQFGSSIFLARILGPTGLGEFSYINAIVNVLAVIASLGFPTVILRLIPSYYSQLHYAKINGLLFYANLYCSLTGFLLGMSLVLYRLIFPNNIDLNLYLIASPLIVITALANIRQKTLQGFERPALAQLQDHAIKHLIFLILAGLILLLVDDFVSNSKGIMLLWFLSSLIIFFIGTALVNKVKKNILGKQKKEFDYDRWRKLSLPFLHTDVFSIILINADIIILGFYMPANEVGIYQIALRISGFISIILSTSNMVLAPWLSKLYIENNIVRMQNIITKTTRIIFISACFIYLILIFLGEKFLSFFWGSEFISTYPILIILGLGQVINVGTGPVMNLAAMTGMQKELAKYVSIVTVFKIIICMLIAPLYGIYGVSIATSFLTILYNIMIILVLKKSIGIKTSILG